MVRAHHRALPAHAGLTLAAARRYLRRIGLAALILLTIVALAPVVGVAVSIGLAATFGCQVDEGSIHPCVHLGVDLGPMLANLFVLGWLALVTAPAIVLVALIWAVLLLRAIFVRLRRRAPRD